MPHGPDHRLKYFHQGVVATNQGDIPVGKITLGTGHAPVDGRDAVAAAAHYDNTGTVAAVVRAGEDAYGIWLAGRLVPGIDDGKVQELRRSGVSGDWRGIDGSLELVAALAVNVPGFPVPRTEEYLSASGAALVAAGIVMRPEDMMPKTPAELRALIAAAIADDAAVKEKDEKRAKLAAMVKDAADAQRTDRRTRAAKVVASARKARAFDKAMTAAAGTDDMKAAPLRRYWTRGKGLARWAANPHPYTALVKNLETEIKTMAPAQIKGLAANYFRDVFGIWPGERKGDNPVGPGSGAPMVAAAPLFPPKGRKKQDEDPAPADRKKAPPFGKDDGPTDPTDPKADDDAPPPPFPPKKKESVQADAVVDDEAEEEFPDAPPPRTGGEPGTPFTEDQAPKVGARGGKLVAFENGYAAYDDGTQTDGETWMPIEEEPEKDVVAAAIARAMGGDYDPKG